MPADGGKGRTKKNNAKGVILAKTVEEVKAAAESLLNDVLVTIQTGEEGKLVQRLYVTDGVDIDKEFYLGITLDRATSKNVIMVSTEGGVEIEKVAEETPEKIVKGVGSTRSPHSPEPGASTRLRAGTGRQRVQTGGQADYLPVQSL